jgi:hypothetical protein
MGKIKTIHGHYSDLFEEEANRIKKLYKDQLNVDITWTEATAIAARRSCTAFWDQRKLKELLSQLRGL